MSLAGSNRKPALTAAASKIGYSRQAPGTLKDQPWQDRAWDVYDKLGPIYYMTRYRSAVARKIDYFAAIRDRPGSDPEIDVTTNEEGEVIAEGTGTKVLEVEGGPELIRRIVSELMVHWDVAGEAYLVRFETDPFWRVLSTQELKKAQGDGYMWMDGDSQKELIDRNAVYRVWKPHPRNHWQADSPTRHVLDDAEGLILSGREIKARSQSRLGAGVWILPDTVDFTPFGTDDEGDEDDFARELTNQLAKPLSDPGSASSLVPWIITMSREDLLAAKEGLVDFAREWDVSIELREEQLNHVALGIDMPPEMANGTAGSMNHWGSWWLTDEAVNMHVLPTVDDILDSLSVNWYRPLLEAGGADPKGYVIWRDSSPATVPTDRSDVAIKLYEAKAISGKALRRVTDFDEEDAPSEEELAQREPVVTEDINVNGPPDREDAVTAAASSAIVAEEPARIDSDLLAWVVEASHQEIERLLALVAAVDPLDESMLDAFAARLDKRIAAAQARVRVWLSRLTGSEVTIDGQAAARAAGVASIVASILTAVRSRLFTPAATPDPIDLGEVLDVAVPVKAIRDGLSLAGGGLPLFEGGKAWELIGNGKDALDVLEARGFRTLSFRWDYGFMPRQEFPPHKALDQREFDSWESSTLTVGSEGSWLARPYYKPGDHRGCACNYVRILSVSLQLPIAASV